jgi:valyl-tRNA synthetase
VADRWILSRLHACVAAVDHAFTSHEYNEAHFALYEFWYRELCDVYLVCIIFSLPLLWSNSPAHALYCASDAQELIKPVMRGSDAAARTAALRTLYTCFDYGLRLMHPLMPFISEELYQRLPGKHTEKTKSQHYESICIAPFPRPDMVSAHHFSVLLRYGV